MRVEALGGAEREVGPAEQPLEAAHQVVVADEPQVAGLAEPDADLVGPWASRCRTVGPTRSDVPTVDLARSPR